LTGINPESTNISEQNGFLYIDLPYTSNGLGDLYTNITGAKFVNLIYTIGLTDSTRLILQLNDGYDYVVSENNDQYTVSFITSGSDAQPEPPTDIDPGNYEVIIPKPAGISNDVITHEDYYYNNQFSIKIPGDYTSYYTNHPVTENSSIITNFKVFLNSDNETEIKFTTSKLQGYKFMADSSNIYVHVGDPKDIYKNIVVLDPGHGGPANGAEYFSTKEKNVNLQILYTIGKKYFNSDPWNLKVYYTRTSDVDMTLSDRASFASKVGADLFVSLHMNASTASSAKGTEVYYSTSNNTPNQAGLTSKKMAEIFVNNVSDTMGTQNRGAKAERYTVVHRNTVPAVLIELGFLSNQSDHALITNSASQEKAVKEIYDTILQIFDEYPTGR
jgi:N-acetylmuramoyl-L-alanine amidase